jgi:hypothetical protein
MRVIVVDLYQKHSVTLVLVVRGLWHAVEGMRRLRCCLKMEKVVSSLRRRVMVVAEFLNVWHW